MLNIDKDYYLRRRDCKIYNNNYNECMNQVKNYDICKKIEYIYIRCLRINKDNINNDNN